MIRCCITCSFLDEAAFKLQPVAMINESAELREELWWCRSVRVAGKVLKLMLLFKLLGKQKQNSF